MDANQKKGKILTKSGSGNIHHIGASLKDLGKKWFAFSRMEMKAEDLFSSVDAQ